MSSLSRACRTALIAIALVVPLAACSGLRPVYQYGEADAERMAVQFGSPTNRYEQIIYNELKLRFLKGGDDAPLGVGAMRAHSAGLGLALGLPSGGEGRLAGVADLIHEHHNRALCISLGPLDDRTQPRQLGRVVGVGRVDVVARPLEVDAEALEQAAQRSVAATP